MCELSLEVVKTRQDFAVLGEIWGLGLRRPADKSAKKSGASVLICSGSFLPRMPEAKFKPSRITPLRDGGDRVLHKNDSRNFFHFANLPDSV